MTAHHPDRVDVKWVSGLTGWSRSTVVRMVHRHMIPGSYQSFPGVQGSPILFVRSRVETWFYELTNAN